PRQGRRLVGIDLGHEAGRLAPRWLVAAGAEMEINPAALELELLDLALAVLLPPGLERQDLQVAGEVLEFGEEFSDGHPSLLCQARRLDSSAWSVGCEASDK